MMYEMKGMKDLIKAYESNFAAAAKTGFKIKYRSKKSESESESIIILAPLEIRSENQIAQWTKTEKGIIALDLRVTTFSTGYSPLGMTVE